MSSVPFCSQMTKCSAFGTQLISYIWDFNYQHKSLPKGWLGFWYEDYVGKLMAEKRLCPSTLFTVVTRNSTNSYAILIPKNTFAMSSLWRKNMLSLSFVLCCSVYENMKLPCIAERVGNPEHSLLPGFIFCTVCSHFSEF